MTTKRVPQGYHTVSPYIIVDDAAALLDFIQQTFGKSLVRTTFGAQRSDGRRLIMNAEVMVGDSMMMLADARGGMKPQPVMLYVYVEDVDAVHAKALKAGASEMMPPTDMFYGDRHGGVVDPAGNTWFIASRVEDMSDAELQRRADEFNQID